MYEDEKNGLIETGIRLKENKLVSLSGGNLSCRLQEDKILVTPSGMAYEVMVPGDIVMLDLDGNILEGTRRPSVDSIALLHVYKHLERVNAIIHTHQPYATAVGMLYKRVPPAVTTLANACAGVVNIAPFASAASLAMGVEAVNNLGDANAVILKNHGVITVGRTLQEALYAAVYMEDALKTFFIAKSMGEPELLTEQQYLEAVEVFKNYGQRM